MNSLIKEKSGNIKGVFGGALSLTLATIAVKLLGVLYKIPLASVLGDTGMGYFNSAYTVYSFFYILCTAGVPKAVMLLISEKIGQGDEAEIPDFLRVAIKAFLIIGVTVSLLFVVFATPLSNFIGSSDSATTMICVAPSIIFASVSGVVRGYLTADMKFSNIAASQVIEGAVKLVLGLVLATLGVQMHLPVYMISALTITGATLGAMISLIYLLVVSKVWKKDIKTRQNEKRIKTFGAFKRIMKVSFPITVSAALMSLSGTLDLFTVMRGLEGIGYSAQEATALYGNYTTTAQSMFNLGISLITPISVAFIPLFARAYSSGDMPDLYKNLKAGLKFTSFVSAPITIGICAFAKEILTLLFGIGAAEVGTPLLILLTPGIIFMSYILMLNSALESLGHPGLAMLSMMIGVAVKAIISVFMLSDPNIGISGAPIGTVISYAVSALISLFLLSHMLGYNIPVFSTSVLPYLVGSISVIIARMVYDSTVTYLPFAAGLIISILLCGVIYIVLYGLLSLQSGEKDLKMAKSTKFV